MTAPPASLAPLMEWALARRHQTLTISDLARHAHLSERSVARWFARDIGVSPGHWLLRQRITEACTLLETTDLAIEAIATRVGLSSAANLRRRFRNELGTTPGAHRRTFSAEPTTANATASPAAS